MYEDDRGLLDDPQVGGIDPLPRCRDKDGAPGHEPLLHGLRTERVSLYIEDLAFPERELHGASDYRAGGGQRPRKPLGSRSAGRLRGDRRGEEISLGDDIALYPDDADDSRRRVRR